MLTREKVVSATPTLIQAPRGRFNTIAFRLESGFLQCVLGGGKGCKDLRCADRPHAADPEDFAFQVVLATGDDDAHLLDDAPHLVILDTAGYSIAVTVDRVFVQFASIFGKRESPHAFAAAWTAPDIFWCRAIRSGSPSSSIMRQASRSARKSGTAGVYGVSIGFPAALFLYAARSR